MLKPLTLSDIEQELLDLADGAVWRGVEPEKLFALARRIAVQIETEKLGARAA